MQEPLVSIICICYNQSRFVRQTLDSIARQTYKNIELIVLDDCSNDNSTIIIKDWIVEYKLGIFITNEVNLGLTKTFNKGLKATSGKYIIDLAADDILDPNFVSNHVQTIEHTSMQNVGVCFCNVELIDDHNQHLEFHFTIGEDRRAISRPKEGNIYAEVLKNFYLPPMSMLVKREVFMNLLGYDENLRFEDVDFWIRSSRKYNYVYVDEILAKKRIHSKSMTNRLFGTILTLKKGQRRFEKDFFKICKKAYSLNRNTTEDKALIERIYFYYWKIIKSCNVLLFFKFVSLHFSIIKRIVTRKY